MIPTCRRKARNAEHIQYDGMNLPEIVKFSGLAITPHGGHAILRYSHIGVIFATIRPSDVLLRGEDNKLRKYTEAQFNLMYEAIP